MSNLTKAQIENALAAWVERASTLKAWIADQNAPKPEDGTAYCSIRVMSRIKTGEDFTSMADDNGMTVTKGPRDFMVYLQGNSEGCFDQLCVLCDSLEKTSVCEALAADGIYFVASEPDVNLTGLDQQSMVERGSLDIRFRAGSEVEDTEAGIIERVEIEGNVLDGPPEVLEANETEIAVNGLELEAQGLALQVKFSVGEAYVSPVP